MRFAPLLSAFFLFASGACAQARALVSWDASLYPPGTIVISQHKRELFLVVDPTRAIAYPVAVGFGASLTACLTPCSRSTAAISCLSLAGSGGT